MPTLAEVIDAFKKDKVVAIVSRFYDNVIHSKKPDVPNHYGTDAFCQFVKYATLNQSIIKRALHENDIRKTELKGELGDDLIQITEWVDVPGLLFGTLGGYSMELKFNHEIVTMFEVDKSDYLLHLESYKKGGWIKLLNDQNIAYSKSQNNTWKADFSRLGSEVDSKKFSL